MYYCTTTFGLPAHPHFSKQIVETCGLFAHSGIPKVPTCGFGLTCLPETTLKLVLLPFDLNKYSSWFVSKGTGSRVAQIVWFPKRVILGRGFKFCSSRQWSFSVWHLMVASVWVIEVKGGASGGGGGSGGGAGGPLRFGLLAETARSSSVLSSSSLRSEKSKALRQRRAVGFTDEPHVWSKSHVRKLSLVCSDCFIGPLKLSGTQKQAQNLWKALTFFFLLERKWLPKSTLHIAGKNKACLDQIRCVFTPHP